VKLIFQNKQKIWKKFFSKQYNPRKSNLHPNIELQIHKDCVRMNNQSSFERFLLNFNFHNLDIQSKPLQKEL